MDNSEEIKIKIKKEVVDNKKETNLEGEVDNSEEIKLKREA